MAKTKAKKNAKASSGKNEQRGFTVAAIMLFVFGAIIMALNLNTMFRSRTMNANASASQEYIDQISSEVLRVNENILEIVGGVGSASSSIEEISLSFRKINNIEAMFEALPDHSQEELRRYDNAKKFTEAYHQRLLGLQDNLGNLDQSTMRAMYVQEIAPLSFTATEMFDSAVDLNRKNVSFMSRQVAMLGAVSAAVIISLIIIGEIGIFVASRISARRREDLEKRTQQAEAAANKFKKSQQKMADLATTNILTNMKNRYALETDLSERLDSDQFTVALFDMDQFRMINDTYGYGFGDEYLSQLAEKLGQDFGQFAEIYNIHDNKFVFVFNREISDAQAQRLSGSVIMTLSSPFNIANLQVQLTASGAVYHYLPGDCLNVDGVLIRLDNTIREAKAQGGNQVLIVNQI